MQHTPEKKDIFQRFIHKIAKTFSSNTKEKSKNQEPDIMSRFTFLNIGFHGDKYLLDIVDALAQNVEAFVETGANVGSTLAYFARKYPHIPCFSCEPDAEAFRHAQQNVADLHNITLYNQTSQQFLLALHKGHPEIFSRRVLFWLDAHGYGFQWPLKEELAFITEKFPQALILIDDFKVPGKERFGYDEYQGQICSYDFVKDSLNMTHSYNVYYPNYTEHTSQHHPLRGWGLITFGKEKDLLLPEHVQKNIYRSQWDID